MKFAHCLHKIFVIGKYMDIFQGGGIICRGRYYLRGKICVGREVSGFKFSSGNCTWRSLPEFH